MVAFPEDVSPVIPYDWHFDFATILSRNPESGRTVVRAARTNDLLSVNLTFPLRPIADYTNLRAFCRWAQGQAQRFTFKDFNGTRTTIASPPLAPWLPYASLGYAGAGAMPCTMTTDGSFAVGDGATLTFDLPFCSLPGSVAGTDCTVYDNGATVSAANYTLSLGTGTDSRDQVIFGGGHAPATGHRLTASAPLARLAIYARLVGDSFAGKTFVGGGGPIAPILGIIQDP